MRKRQPKHESQLKSIEAASAAEVIRRMRIIDYKDIDYLDSEVVAAIIRNRIQESDGVVTEAVVVLNQRIQLLVRRRFTWPWMGMIDRGSTVIEDTINYVWDILLEDVGISNCEVYFAVFVRERVDDYMRHLLTLKNSMPSIDAMAVDDEEGGQTPMIDMMEGDTETPEDISIRNEQSEMLQKILLSLPQAERSAFYFRRQCEYDWNKVADLMGCSIPTARQHLKRSLEKLEGMMK